ncbi:MAG: penicillin-binding protein 2 [Firmicutes bacterium]|nr:penicillin-binding protein 2 [Bacillota bacterium]
MNKKVHSIERRLIALLVFIFICVAGIVGRLFFVQAVSAAKYEKEAEQQRLCIIEIPPKRGSILDRNGNELAVSVMMDTIYATPYLIEDRKQFAKKIAPILKVDEQELLNKLTKQGSFAYLARKADSKTVQEVKKFVQDNHIRGIGFLKESKRYYPNESLGAHVLGFAGMDNKGLAGLELYYDDVLYGKPGRIEAERDANGRPIPQSVQRSYKAEDGSDIRISIDREIQYEVETELAAAVEKYKAKSGSVIVMNPKNGEIYAMANVPCYNPNQIKDTLNDGNSRNIAVTDLYEPGSTMKAVIACGALQEGLCNPSTEFFLEPEIRIGSKSIKDAHTRPAVNYTLSKIIQESSNVGMVKVGLMMGRTRISAYLEKFGFNQKTGIDFPGEAKGFYPKAENWSQMSLANIPFGQGISTTQLRMVEAFATIANDGIPVKPHFLVDVTDPRGRVTRRAAVIQEQRVIDAQTCRQMKTILENVVLDGTGTQAKVLNYRVGGKTGTAQKAKVHGRGYEKDKFVASFIGMVPVQDPELVISVVIDEPQESIYGGSVAAPVFSRIAEFTLRYLKIPPQ